MFKRVNSLNFLSNEHVADAARVLENEGRCILRGVFSSAELAELRQEVLSVYERVPADMRASAISPEVGDMYRYRLFEHSALAQRAIGKSVILDVIEPLLGSDCHVIACTSWKNPPGEALTPHGLQWHIDGGPHVPRAKGAPWPAHVPYPIFVIASHIYLEDVRLEDGPTACIPGSHTSGQVPPLDRQWDDDLAYSGSTAVHHVVRAGDVDFRVSDVWHRRWPPARNARGRLFIQTNYGRRDIAQRLIPCSESTQVTPIALARCETERERRLFGLHPQCFFDA